MSLVVCLAIRITTDAAPALNGGIKGAEWSEAVNRLQARIVLERSQVSNGTPLIATYLKLRNASDVMNPLVIPWDGKLMKFRVVDAKGNDVPRSKNFVYDGPMLKGTTDLVLPIRGELSFDYSSHGAGIPADMAALIDLGVDAIWMLERSQSECFLQATLEVPGRGLLRGGAHWHGRIELPPVKIPVQAEPIDAATTKARINELGQKMLRNNGRESEDAERALSLIDDPGVISWYAKAIELNDYHLKFCSMDRLSRYDNDEAVAALKKGIATTANDFGARSNESVKPALAHNIRVAAAQGLARSPHRDAKPLLLTFSNDHDPSIRLEVVHLLGRMETPESLDMLKKLSSDPGELVRSKAKRYLDTRAKSENSSNGKK
jgi:HEAT repeats